MSCDMNEQMVSSPCPVLSYADYELIENEYPRPLTALGVTSAPIALYRVMAVEEH
jgi:hypothetical protein